MVLVRFGWWDRDFLPTGLPRHLPYLHLPAKHHPPPRLFPPGCASPPSALPLPHLTEHLPCPTPALPAAYTQPVLPPPPLPLPITASVPGRRKNCHNTYIHCLPCNACTTHLIGVLPLPACLKNYYRTSPSYCFSCGGEFCQQYCCSLCDLNVELLLNLQHARWETGGLEGRSTAWL